MSSQMEPETAKHLKAAAEIVRDAAAARAGRFSRRIPLALRVTGNAGAGYCVEADPKIAPNAYPFEPDMGAPPGAVPNYHPTGKSRKVWGRQPYRPFIQRGVTDAADRPDDEVAQAINDWCDELDLPCEDS